MSAANRTGLLHTPASLLFRLRQPEETAAWGRFVDLYTPLLFRWARQLGQQDSDCADLVQDVFLILWRKLPEFEYDSGRSFHAWLKTLFLNRHRSRQRARGIAPQELESLDPADSLSDSTDPEETRYLIRQAFRLIEREFSPLHQQAFRAYVLEERAPEEVAAKLGLSPGTVYGIKSKILSRLRQELKQILD
jgi:RNA polymerase sigma-70 factor (ECF subfamily)